MTARARPLRRFAADAIANVLATPWRFAVVAALLALTLCWTAGREASLVRSLQTAKRDQQAAGRYVSVISLHNAAAHRAIAGDRCDALAALTGVRSAGVLAPSGTAVLRSAPDGRIALWRVSPGLLHLLGVASGRSGVYVGSAAADELGLRSGARVTFERPRVAAPLTVFPAHGPRTALLDRAILLVEPPANVVGSCYVDLDGISANSAAEFLGALIGAGAVDVRPLASRVEFGADPAQAYRQQSTRWLAFTAPLLPWLVWLLLLRVRRAELALARIFGCPRTLLAYQLVVEFAVCLAVALPPPVAVVVATSWGDRIALDAGCAGALAGCAVALVLGVVGALLSSVRRGTELAMLRGAE